MSHMESDIDPMGHPVVVARLGIMHDSGAGQDNATLRKAPAGHHPAPCVNQRPDVVGAGPVPARSGLVREFGTGRHKGVPYVARGGSCTMSRRDGTSSSPTA